VRVKFGLTLPIFDELADPRVLAGLARAAESGAWDGIFVWDHVYYRAPVAAATDPWIAIAAMATQTTSILLGPMVTPLARRRPQVVARQVVALDHLSNGRIVLGVGLGLDQSGGEFQRFGEETDTKRRAEILDEALELVVTLLRGDHADHDGRYFRASDVTFLPRPVHGRVPIWVAARWPHRRPLRRAAKHDGVFVIDIEPAELSAVVEEIAAHRTGGFAGYDIVVHVPPSTDPLPWAAAGATWMLTTFDPFRASPTWVREVIAAGPGHAG
jgi:alkanesulfonate monooxygenase SsuD/methylene tetrahydromethanopterin reductase-like flavin-dependent oxidoreductase (luciferase family)